MQHSAPIFIAPECHAPGCHHDGDQYTMVKCRSCDHWFCTEHLDSQDTIRRISIVETGLPGLSYYLGLCTTCRGTQVQRRRRVDSSWLR
jgi:hypothetical protein